MSAGKIESVYSAKVKYEFSVAPGDGTSYLVIYGTHINGGFICIPNHNIGCEAGSPDDSFYNCGKLTSAGLPYEIAKVIADTIQAFSETNSTDNGD